MKLYYIFGGREGDRTPDLRIANAALSQLSYTPNERRCILHAITRRVKPFRSHFHWKITAVLTQSLHGANYSCQSNLNGTVR
jgi:hypothetical protein